MYLWKNNQYQRVHSEKERKRKAAAGTNIHYDPNLLSQLKNDHQALLGLYMEIKSAFDMQDYTSVTNKLDQFRSILQDHLLRENVKLYIYLTHVFKTDDTNYEMIRNFRNEMDGIVKTAMYFLKKCEAIGVDAELAASFDRDLVSMGEVLGMRIKKEENVLYPLYTENY